MFQQNNIIQSSLLLQFSELIHGISTKFGGYNSPPFFNNLSYKVSDDSNHVTKNRKIFFTSLGINIERLAIPKQIHSANMRIISSPGSYPETDALITSTRNVFLIVSVADCYPILIYDSIKSISAIVHSGWRGTQKQILKQTINKLISEFGSEPKDLSVFIGPGITKEHFEVGNEVAKQFDAKYIKKRKERFYIDLKANLLGQLDSLHIPIENIDISPFCTFKEKDYLHSYRRDKNKSGRMMAVIGMR